MRLLRVCVASAFAIVLGELSQNAWGQSFAAPAGGWAYTFAGDVAVDGGGDGFFKSLDGTWDHDNGSDEWDGSAIGEGLPGGASALAEDGADFIRVQDTGDPRDALGVSDPGSNRKVYLTHRLTDDFTDTTRPGNLPTLIDDGVTLHFRMRISTAATGPVDPLHPDGGSNADVVSWPDRGIGYHQHNGGKSMIAIKQSAAGNGANVAFGFAYGDDVNADLFQNANGEIQHGLILPHLLQSNDLNNASDPGGDPPMDLSTEFGNFVAVDDPTAWQEFWVTIQAGTVEVDGFDDGTHVVNVFHDGAADPLTAQAFGINAASGTDFGGDEAAESYIAIGAGATPLAGAFDLDFLSWAPGIHVPLLSLGLEGDCNGDGAVDAGDLACVSTIEERDAVLGAIPTLPGDLDGNGDVAFPDFLVFSANFAKDVASYTDGDIDLNGNVAFPDFLVLSANFGQVPAGGATTAAVPEPSSLALFGLAGLLMGLVRRP